MWKSSAGAKSLPLPKAEDDDDWDTDPNFVNNLSEKESRWGAKTIEGSGHQDSVRLDQLRDEVLKSDGIVKESLTTLPKPSAGYGGKFGVQTDRVDKCAEKYDYKGKVEPHASQKDYSKGFGGAFGVDKDRQDKSAFGWTDKEVLSKHESQKDYAVGFGGKHGVQSDRIDKSAVGWDHHEKLHQHESQTDYKQGFGGKYGIQQDRKDKSAVGWEDHEKLQQHESQTDYKKGFGGQYGVQSDRKDKSAVGWDDQEKLHQHESQSAYKKSEFEGQARNVRGWKERQNLEKHDSQKAAPIPTEKGRASNLRSKFEQLATQDQDAKVREERERRKREDEELRQKQAETERIRQQKIDNEWAQQNENEKVVEVKEERNSQLNSPAKTRPSIGIRLPYSAATASDDAPPKPVRTSEYVLDSSHQQTPLPPSSQPDNSKQPKAVVPPTSIEPEVSKNAEIENKAGAPTNTVGQTSILASSMMRRRNSSTSADEGKDDDDEWGDTNAAFDEKNQFILQSPPLGRNITLTHSADDKEQQESSSKGITSGEPLNVSHTQQSQTVQSPQQRETSPAEEAIPAQQSANQGGNAGHPLTATALFDYEKQDDDEISFDVNDVITDIEQIDVGWWRGMCKGRFGLFPANYVHLNQ